MLTNVAVVVLLGGKARDGWRKLGDGPHRLLHTETCPHPSHLGIYGQGSAQAPARRDQIRAALVNARERAKLAG